MNSFIIIYYIFFVCALIIFSFSQIDLNLTLSGNPLYQRFQQDLIQLGYYQRDVSATIFLILMVVSFIGFIWLLQKSNCRLVSYKLLIILIGITCLLVFAYPAFSHDLFNYIFDSRVVVHYSLSPSYFKALDFPDDAWTRFMHWTHRYYPYGPAWLFLSLIPVYLGMNKFVWTLLLFKLMFLTFHLLNIWLIANIARLKSPQNVMLSIIYYAFNPLILIESLVSPHNEVAMLTFVLLSIYLLMKKRIVWFVVAVVFSAAIKYVSIIILPWSWIVSQRSKHFIMGFYWLWLVVLIPLIINREAYSWYFIPIIGLSALMIDSKWTAVLTLSLSVSMLLRYYPLLLLGESSKLAADYQTIYAVAGFITIGLLLTLIRKRIPVLNSITN